MLDTQANVPASVAVVFPRADSSILGTDVYEVSVTLASLALTEYDGEFGRPDVSQIIHSTAVANYSGGGSPVNAAELLALAQQIATDFYLWRLALVEVRYRSIVPWTADGMHDVEWTHGGGMTTAVHRSEWDPEFGQLKHAGTYGSSDVPAATGITHINNDATALQQIAVGDAGSDLNIATTAAAYDNAKTYSAGWVVLSSGSTYRFINATPSAGHTPPNATYWEDVTGQGLTIANVPRIASINGDATAAQLITSTSDTVKISQPSAGTTNLEVPSGCDRFRSSGTTLTTTWTCPASVTSVFVQAFGPSGVYPDSASTGFWKAGGGGAYASSTLTVVPGRVYDIEVFPAFIGSVGYAKIAYSGTDLVKAVGGNRDVGGDYSACVGTEKVSGGDGGGDASINSTGSGTGITGSGGGGGAGQAIPGYSGESYTADVNARAGRGGFGYSNGFSGEFNSSTSTTFGGDQPGGGHGAYYGGGAAPNGRGLGELRITWGIGSAIKGVKGQVALISDPASGIRVRNTVQSSTDLDSALQITLDIPVTTSKGGTGRTTLDSGQLIAGAGTSAVDSLSSTRVVGETIELKLGSDSWIAFSEGSF